MNETIERIATLDPPARYHDNEDRLAEFVRDSQNWDIKKIAGRWTREDDSPLRSVDYVTALEQGAFDDPNIENLLYAASGRVHAAIKLNQRHFDEIEESPQIILASVITSILYHRDCDNW